MAQWNTPVVNADSEGLCAYDIIARNFRDFPNDIAVSAWDGEMAYCELDRYSSVLAQRLLEFGAGPGQIIPVYTEKSKWVVVYIAAIIKTGAAFLFIDGSSPLSSLELICDMVSATLMICSSSRYPTAQETSLHIISLSDWIEQGDPAQVPAPCVNPSALLYAVFTSGSTKAPKCVAMKNRTCCAANLRGAHFNGTTRHTRRLQYSSYSWTLSIWEILMTLFTGSTLCVPSDTQRGSAAGLAAFMNKHAVTFATFTPCFVDLPEPDDVPSLQMLMLGGEPVSQALVQKWAPRVRLILGYGATETGGIAVMVPDARKRVDLFQVGERLDPCSWVVDMENPHRLVLLGGVSKLVLQGPGIARGYIKNEELTRERFFDRMNWQDRVAGFEGAGRLYRTGDLVRYAMDGSIRLVGRREEVLKANGQFIGFRALEDQIRETPTAQTLGVKGVAAIAVRIPGAEENCTTGHVAFLEGSALSQLPQEYISRDGLDIVKPAKCESAVQAIKRDLAAVVARDLVPGQMFFMQSLVRFNPSGKIDRRTLPMIAAELVQMTEASRPGRYRNGC